MTNSAIPSHVAIIMDGNGRWAKRRLMPRGMGHRAGVKAAQNAIDYCLKHRIPVLTLFALSVENFLHRPKEELKLLFSLFSDMLTKHLKALHEKQVRIRVVGDISVFSEAMQAQIQEATTLTINNAAMQLVLALNYSGRWDITQAAKQFAQAVSHKNLNENASESDFAKFLSLADLPDPDLFIRTSGEQRISNFYLWQLAYTELYFTDAFWPDFDSAIFDSAIAAFQHRERRFGLTSEQLTSG